MTLGQYFGSIMAVLRWHLNIVRVALGQHQDGIGMALGQHQGWLWGGTGLTLGQHQDGFGTALGQYQDGFGVAPEHGGVVAVVTRWPWWPAWHRARRRCRANTSWRRQMGSDTCVCRRVFVVTL